MNSQGYKLTSELDKGLKMYGEDNNLSPSFILNNLVESFLIDKGYLNVKSPIETVEVASEKIKHAYFEKKSNRYRIMKWVNCKKYNFASVTQGARVVKEIVQFLESKDWDIKYSIKSTGLKGVNQINFLFDEMEKEGFNYDGKL